MMSGGNPGGMGGRIRRLWISIWHPAIVYEPVENDHQSCMVNQHGDDSGIF
jgi:hypothetical protein